MAFSDIANIASTLIASAAFYLSYKAFQQQQTFENENHYYEYKFNNYVGILKAMGNYLTTVQDDFYNAHDKFKGKEIGVELAREIDEKANVLQNNIETMKNFLPNEVIEQIDKALDVIYDNEIDQVLDEDNFIEIQKHFKILADAMGDVEKAMIKDLGLINIHKRLIHRTRETKKVKPQ